MKNAMNSIIELQEFQSSKMQRPAMADTIEFKDTIKSVMDLQDLQGPKGWPIVGSLFQLN